MANRNIETLLLSGRFEIEEAWGMEQLAQYLQELALLDAGVAYADLGIGALSVTDIGQHGAISGQVLKWKFYKTCYL